MKDWLSLQFGLILVLFVLYLFFAFYWADSGIRNYITPSVNWESLTEWTNSYFWWAIAAVVGSFSAVLAWYWVTCSQRDAHWKNFNRRKLWIILWIAASLAGFLCAWPAALGLDRGRMWVFVPNTFLACSYYYLATMLFSPTAFAHTPFLARKIRMW